MEASGYNGNVLETCKVTVSATSINLTASMAAFALVSGMAAAIYVRRKRRTALIQDLEGESPVQTDFVELSHTHSGVTV